MFCPNCGTQNDSAATPCKKCGFKLSGISVPKFKGTMMLNSDQTVNEMVEEHRRKQARGEAAEQNKDRASDPAPRKAPGSSAPPSSLGGPKGPVFQPPRAAVPARGRMGGTMLGVAPQVGGYVPPQGAVAPAPSPSSSLPPGSEPARSGAAAPAEATAPAAPNRAVSSAAALAGTVEVPQAEPSASGPPADEPATKGATPSPVPPVPALADAPETAAVDATEGDAPAEIGGGDVAGSDVPSNEPAPVRAVPATAPLPRVTEPEKPAPAAQAAPASRSRLHALDIVLILFTCGIYGLVLWAKRRRA